MKNILVAEDNDFNFFVVEALLESKHYTIIRAENGEEAVDYLKSHNDVSLVLMDVQMPVMDGFTATREIRKIDKKIPIVFQTSYAYDKIRQEAFESGCTDFVAKPLSMNNLIPVVEKYMLHSTSTVAQGVKV